MSGVCPTPAVKQTTDFSDPGTYTVSPPNSRYNTCGGATDVQINDPTDPVTTTVCCPSPGPAGPAGPTGQCGAGFNYLGSWVSGTAYYAVDVPDQCSADVVYHNGSSYICKLDHVGSGSPDDTEPGVGSLWTTYWDVLAAGKVNQVIWRGLWQEGVDYVENDFITHNGESYMCTISHTSSVADEPDPVFDYEGGLNWILVSRGGLEEEEQSWFDNLFDGVFDWVKDIGNWGLGDWLKALAIGAGLAWIGSKLTDMFNEDGTGDGEANSQFTGDLCYTGAFTAPTLQEVVSDICDWAGIASYDVSDLPTNEVNFTLGNLTSARAILEMLSLVYFFDMVDSGGTLKFISRSSTGADKSLTVAEDFGWTRDGDSVPAPYSVKRYQGVDLPRQFTLTYYSEAAGHNKMAQTATLQTFTEGQDVSTEIPITLTDSYAYHVAEKAMVNAHVERTVYSFTTNWKHMDLEPGDIIDVDELGKLRILKIDEEQEYGLLTVQAVDAILGNSYTTSNIPAQDPEPYIDVPKEIGYSAGLIVELPPMEENDKDNPHLTLVPHGFGKSGWPGCAIYYSTDGGTSYNLFGNTTTEATWGKVATATATPPASSPYLWDESTTIQVELKTGSLESVTKQDVYNGINWAMVGDEIIGFRTASLVSGTTYNLSGLLRGRRGSFVNADSHVNNEAFVLLDDAVIEFPYDIAQKNTTFYFKFVTIGSDISKATAYDAQPSTVSLRPWQVSDLNAVATGSPADWTITWTGTNQFDSYMVDSQPIPQPEKFGGFVLQIVDQSGSPEVIKRTVTQQNTSFTYTNAMQVTDFGTTQSSITVRVSQIDQRVGPGYDNTQTF